jgi:hypothetical protein
MAIEIQCPTIDANSQGICIRMPGGGKLSVMTPVSNPSQLEIVKPLLAQVNAGLAPLIPVFNIIDAVLQLKNVVEAIPKALTSVPPKPQAIVDEIEELVKKTAKLAELIPQVSTPLMILDIVDTLIATMNGVLTELETIALQQARIAAAKDKANSSGNTALQAIVDCATGVSNTQMVSLGEGLAPLNTLIGVLNLFLELIGLPTLPNLAELSEDSLEAIDQIRSVIEVLEFVRGKIPIP